MRSRGVAKIANSILNASEMDEAVAALIDASRAVGHRGGYLECAQHVEEAFGQQFDTHHCSVTDRLILCFLKPKRFTTIFHCLLWSWSVKH
ncbi:hypothetical protein HanPI659440_Chr13g0501041 [Helianthus annuus]|nr:hypothetical protein HanPI659440_Chr13g0501041 [Helianthus annuus]